MHCITESRSCTTLVDVDGMKASSEPKSAESKILIQDLVARDDSASSSSSCAGSVRRLRELHLPLFPDGSANFCLKNNPLISSAAAEVLKEKVDTFSISNTTPSSPVIYVHQRELAHASLEQYDNNGAILTSDSATTCHILALRSYVRRDSKSRGLGSLCHIDTTRNGSCIFQMIKEHLLFHQIEIGCSSSSKGEHLNMDVHIVGGYNDKDKTSEEITHHVFGILSKAANEFKSILRMTLKTCVVTSLNDAGRYSIPIVSGPMVRGMALDVSTGEVHLLNSVAKSQRGPASTLRHVRLWAPPSQNNFLLTVHSWNKEQIVIKPFEYGPFPDMDLFLQLPDDTLLEFSSTSPECEADDFCDEMRKTVRFVRDVPVHSVFGEERKAIIYDFKKPSLPNANSSRSCWVKI